MVRNKIDLISRESIESYGDLYLIFASILCNDKTYYHIKNMKEDVYEQLIILLNSIIVFQLKFVCGLIGFDTVMRTHWIRHHFGTRLDLAEN